MTFEKIRPHHLERKALLYAAIVGSSGSAQPREQRAAVCHAGSPGSAGLVADRGDR